MPIELVALFAWDGSAFVKRNDALLFIAPPYEKRNIKSADEKALDRAVLKFGFAHQDKRFDSWDSLIEFLHLAVQTARRERGQVISETALRGQIMDVAPVEVLNRFLDKVQQELLPLRLFDQAESVVWAMLDSENATRSDDVRKRAISLLRQIHAEKRMTLAQRLGLDEDDSPFKSLQRTGMMQEARALANSIAARKSIWLFEAQGL